jgi:hypothetical protein
MGNVATILDTTQTLAGAASAETGPTQTLKLRQLSLGEGAYVEAVIGSGDTVILEGNISGSASVFQTIATFTASALIPVDLPSKYRARRSVDGGGADSQIYVQTKDTTGVV